MRELFDDLFIDPFRDNNWFGLGVGILMWIMVVVIIFFTVWFIVRVVDSSFLPLKEKEGVVTSKYITPAHTTTSYIMSGKVMIPISTFHREAYDIEITIDGLVDQVSLYPEYWNKTTVGQTICCKYTNGRICQSLYIKSFCE